MQANQDDAEVTLSKNAANTRGRPFKPGNVGKPKGARHRATLAAEALLDGEADKLTRKAVQMALAGDAIALRLCLERLIPPRRDRPVIFDLPPIVDPRDHPAALSTILSAVAAGDLTPPEAEALARVLGEHRKAVETADLAARIASLEQKL